jgi:hypothetical protein
MNRFHPGRHPVLLGAFSISFSGLLVVLVACGGDSRDPLSDNGFDTHGELPFMGGDAMDDATSGDIGNLDAEVDTSLDSGPETDTADAGTDAFVEPTDPPWVPPDGAFRLSLASRDIPVPLGISTGGYGQTPGSGAPRSPFADMFQATVTLLHQPRVQVVHLLADGERAILVQTDLIAVFQSLYARVSDLVKMRTGVDIADRLIFLANHTHTGPARIFDTPLAAFFSDTYEELLFQRVADAVAGAIVEAMTGEAEAVRMGRAELQNDRMHSDRRCANPPHRNDAMGVVRFDRLGDDRTLAVLINYSLHGTVFGYQDGVLGGDSPRSVELKVAEALPGHPTVLFLQSWTGDMAPTNPVDDFAPHIWPASADPTLDRLEALGRLAAETILAAWNDFEYESDPSLAVESRVAPIGWEAIGYVDGEWDYHYGAIFCGGGASVCSGPSPVMDACLALDVGWLPETVRFSAMRLGGLVAVTLPGEPHTELGEQLVEAVVANTGAEAAWVLGYGQDYVGYLMTPDDWAGGGYEPGMAFWGPRQGLWSIESAASVARLLADPQAATTFEPAMPVQWVAGPTRPYVPAPSIDAGSLVQDLPADAQAGDVLTFRWSGGDPWVDRPEVVLESRGDHGFSPVLAGGRLVDARDYRMTLRVQPEPPWSAAAPDGRRFTWIAELRTAVAIPAPRQALEGAFRLAVSGLAVGTDGTDAPYDLVSGVVRIELP